MGKKVVFKLSNHWICILIFSQNLTSLVIFGAADESLAIDLPAYFAGRILPVDVAVSDRWCRLLAKVGRPIPAIDSLLAATALQHGLTMVTRNLKDFVVPELLVLDPWTE